MNARVMDQYRRLKGFIGTVVQHVAFGQSAGLRHNLAVQVGRKQLVAAAPPWRRRLISTERSHVL